MFCAYMRALETHPYTTKMATSTTLYIAGDALAQRLDGSWQRKGRYDTQRGKAAIIWGQTTTPSDSAETRTVTKSCG